MTAFPSLVADDIPSLVALLERQRLLYRHLRELSQRQGPLVAEGLAEPLLALLAQRQQLIEQLAEVNARLDPYRRRWEELCGDLPAGDRERVGELVRDVQELLSSIIEQDERDRHALQIVRSRVGGEIQKVTSAGNAVNAYRAAPGRAVGGVFPGGGSNRFMNQQG